MVGDSRWVAGAESKWDLSRGIKVERIMWVLDKRERKTKTKRFSVSLSEQWVQSGLGLCSVLSMWPSDLSHTWAVCQRRGLLFLLPAGTRLSGSAWTSISWDLFAAHCRVSTESPAGYFCTCWGLFWVWASAGYRLRSVSACTWKVTHSLVH